MGSRKRGSVGIGISSPQLEGHDLLARGSQADPVVGVGKIGSLLITVNGSHGNDPRIGSRIIVGGAFVITGGSHHNGALIQGILNGVLLGLDRLLAAKADIDHLAARINCIIDGLGGVRGISLALLVQNLEG